MSNYKSLQHTKWECKYHVVFIPKYRKKLIYGELRRHLGQVLRRLAGQKESLIEEGHLLPDHVHVMISIPPKFSVAQVIGYIKGKAPSTLRGTFQRVGVTLLDSTSGLADTSYRRWVGMRK